MNSETTEENLSELGINCYLISDFDSDKVSVVRETIEKLGIGIFSPSDLSNSELLTDNIMNLIKEADFIVAVTGFKKGNTSSIFEIGLALGMNKTVFVVSENYDLWPYALNLSPVIRCSVNDMKTFEHTLKIMLNAKTSLAKVHKSERNKKEIKKIEFPTIRLLEDLEVAVENNSEREILGVVEKVFKYCSINAMAGQGGGEHREDFAIWSNELEEVIGNPIIVELKIQLNTVDALINCENQIRKLLEKRKAQSAIVLTFTLLNNPAIAKHLKYPNILFFDIRDFIKEVGEKGLAQTVRETRNAIARIRRSSR